MPRSVRESFWWWSLVFHDRPNPWLTLVTLRITTGKCTGTMYYIPSGKHTKSYWKWPFSSWIYPLNIVIFHSYVKVYQRVVPMNFDQPAAGIFSARFFSSQRGWSSKFCKAIPMVPHGPRKETKGAQQRLVKDYKHSRSKGFTIHCCCVMLYIYVYIYGGFLK